MHPFVQRSERSFTMPRLSKKAKKEWAFFIHPITHRRTYNEICRSCTRDCKQSFRAKIIECRRYESKRAVHYARKNAPNQCKRQNIGQLRETTTHLRKAAYRGQKRQKPHPFNTKNRTKGVRTPGRKIQVVGSWSVCFCESSESDPNAPVIYGTIRKCRPALRDTAWPYEPFHQKQG